MQFCLHTNAVEQACLYECIVAYLDQLTPRKLADIPLRVHKNACLQMVRCLYSKVDLCESVCESSKFQSRLQHFRCLCYWKTRRELHIGRFGVKTRPDETLNTTIAMTHIWDALSEEVMQQAGYCNYRCNALFMCRVVCSLHQKHSLQMLKAASVCLSCPSRQQLSWTLICR